MAFILNSYGGTYEQMFNIPAGGVYAGCCNAITITVCALNITSAAALRDVWAPVTAGAEIK